MRIRDMEIVVTGKFEILNPETDKFFTRKEIQKKIEDMGGIAGKTVTKNTDILVTGPVKNGVEDGGKRSSKMIKAEEYGVKTMEIGEFVEQTGIAGYRKMTVEDMADDIIKNGVKEFDKDALEAFQAVSHCLRVGEELVVG